MLRLVLDRPRLGPRFIAARAAALPHPETRRPDPRGARGAAALSARTTPRREEI